MSRPTCRHLRLLLHRPPEVQQQDCCWTMDDLAGDGSSWGQYWGMIHGKLHMGWLLLSKKQKQSQIYMYNILQSCAYFPSNPDVFPEFPTIHDHPNIFWIAHAGLAQLPDRPQKEPRCFQERRQSRCQWPMSWLHVHQKKYSRYLRTQISGLQHCLDMFGLHHNKVGTVNRNL